MCDPRDLNRRSASAVVGPEREFISTDTLLSSSTLSGGEEPASSRASDLRERVLDLMGKEEDRGSPVFISSIWSICDSHEHSHRSASAEAR